MNIIDNVYISNNIKHPKRVIRKFRRNKLVPGIFILRQAYGNDQFEIVRADFFRQKFLRDEPLSIIGFAANYDDAIDLSTKLVEDAIKAIGEPDVKRYLGL